jgi:hypothetical protein
MDALTRQFLDSAAAALAQASADLGALIARPDDIASARRLERRLSGVGIAARAAGFSRIAGLVEEAQEPLCRALTRGGGIDRPTMQALGWGVQAVCAEVQRAAQGRLPAAA